MEEEYGRSAAGFAIRAENAAEKRRIPDDERADAGGREVSATPGANDYAARFKPYPPPAGSAMAFTDSQLRANAVVRWEYRPGSTMFVVWQHGRQDYENQNLNRSWTSDYNDLLSIHPDNTFLLKFTYWLSR